jgi:hypothetical protein
MTRLSLVLVLTCGLIACGKDKTAQRSTTEGGGYQIDHPCINQTYERRLFKVVTTTLNTAPGEEIPVNTQAFFYDASGRIDSISDFQCRKIIYGPDGNVIRCLLYQYDDPQVLWIVQDYEYMSGKISKIINNDIIQSHTRTAIYSWNDSNLVESIEWEGEDRKETFTYDDCGNLIKSRYFNTLYNLEEMFTDFEYKQSINPLYLIGMNKILPNISVNNVSKTDVTPLSGLICLAFDELNTTYEYGSDGLPINSINEYWSTEYFYE